MRRGNLLNEIQRLVKDEAPWIFLWFQTDFYGVSDRIDWQTAGRRNHFPRRGPDEPVIS